VKKIYRLGETYVDKAARNHEDDQFLRWINIDKSGMANSPGVRPLKYTSSIAKSESKLPAYLILVTNENTSGPLNPWDDVIDISNAEILYWGDAKAHDTKVLEDFTGNLYLRRIYDYILKGDTDLIPPILHFSKPVKGIVKFNGLCVLNKLDIKSFESEGVRVKNYLANLTILDCEAVHVDWLHSRVKSDDPEIVDSHQNCPEVWLDYKSGRIRPRNDSLINSFLIKEEKLIEEEETEIDEARKVGTEDRRAKIDESPKRPIQIRVVSVKYKRNPYIVVEALERAKGICELCKKPAPFNRAKDGAPYLEVHHRKPLKDGGLDTMDNVLAICPNCHRKEHFG